MKLKFLLFMLTFFAVAQAQAGVTAITRWDGALPKYNEDDETVKTTCSQACAEYSLITLVCPEGEILVDCPEDGCSYYHRCEKDTSSPQE